MNRAIQTNNKSGVAGVCYLPSSKVWEASVYDCFGKLRRKTFSVKKYGDADAKAKAIACRQQNEIDRQKPLTEEDKRGINKIKAVMDHADGKLTNEQLMLTLRHYQ